jgi:hypothetical protein
MKRLITIACFATLISCSTGCCDKGSNRLDIALEGPWILYQDTQFDGNGTKVPVLIAIAPTAAIDYAATMAGTQHKSDSLHHKPPQLSTGDGYYIPTPDIYCLTFNDECARKGSATLASDHYPGSSLLTIPFHGAQDQSASWDWVQVGRSGNTVLILPMPDSYSDDGVFPMHFAANYNENGDGYQRLGNTEGHSIGLHLHYVHGPDRFNLVACAKDRKPSEASCRTDAPDPVRRLDNSGTLRIQMRAPEDESACDNHVRFAYGYVYKLIGNNFNQDYAFVEPAIWDSTNHVYKYEDHNSHTCLTNDPQPGIHSGRASNQNHSEALMGSVGQTQGTSGTILILPIPIDSIIDQIKDLNLTDNQNQDLESATKAAQSAQSASGNLDPNFPRISQVLRIGQFLTESRRALENYEKDPHTKLSPDQLKKLADVKQREDDDTTKNGNDCRAPVVMMQ